MSAGSRPYHLGVDVGGTFTDLVRAVGDDVEVAKVPSTPDDQARGILAGLERLATSPAELARFAHGTTVATNAVLERSGARVLLVTTAGFGDLLTIGRQERPELYALDARRPLPVVGLDDHVEVDERVGPDGAVLTALTDDEVARVVEAVAEAAPDAVALSLLFAFLTDDHERRLAGALRDRLGPQIPVSVASELLPVFREVERTSTVALNAYVAPTLGRYLRSLQRQLTDGGLQAPVEVMRSGGGTSLVERLVEEPVHALLSGPAAGAWGAAAVGASAGIGELVAVDVGGTSTDVTLISGGRPATTAEGSIDGAPFAVATTDVHTIGAGGGSLAWLDDGGALRVGPRSAGAVPGPACYGNGGERATVTDANVVLGRLDPEARLGGHLPLRADLAHRAVARLAEELGQGVAATTRGILDVTDAQMVRALRVVSVERGVDPRGLALVPAGGAGPLHQAALAAGLGCARVLVPANPGVLSAVGLLAAPVTVERVRSRPSSLADLDVDLLRGAWDELADEAVAALTAQGVEAETVQRIGELRYRGQAYELPVPADEVSLEGLAEALHDAHLERYGYDQRDQPVELITLRVRAEGPTPPSPLPRRDRGGAFEDAVRARRDVDLGDGAHPTPIVERDALGAGATLRGPAVLIGVDSTVAVAGWQRGEVDEHGSLLLEEAP